jgi:uncharacterized RDD family membrane protein YckC
MPALSEQIDTQIEVVTPENIAFQYRIAGPFQRLPAYIIDKVLQFTSMFFLFLVIGIAFDLIGLSGVGAGLAIVGYFLITWFYGGVFETLWNGQTPGKRLMRLRVLTVEGQPINALQAVLRNVLRAVDILPPVFYMVGFASACWDDRFARLGDLACGTMVIVEEPLYASGVMRVAEPEALALAAQLPVHVTVSRPLALALSSYVGKRRYLPWSRRVQIARYVAEPLREQFQLPVGTSYDLLLCAVYQRVFFADETETSAADIGESPFAPAA